MILTTTPDNELGICIVPKSSSTTWAHAFGHMNNIKHEDTQDQVSNVYVRVASSPIISKQASTYYDVQRLNDVAKFKFIFVRHPFERLGSYFHWIFDPPGVKYSPLALQAIVDYENKSKHDTKTDTMESITFLRFVDYVLHEASSLGENDMISHLTAHWWPYTETCRVCLVTYDFVGHLETFGDDAQLLADKFPSNSVLKKIGNSKRLGCKGSCKADKLVSRYLEEYKQLKKESITQLYMFFKNDFEFGGYEYPHYYIENGIS